MNKSIIKALTLTLAIGALSLIGFNPAYGYGGGGFVTYCENVVYGEWGTCINDRQYRDVISPDTKRCNLSTSQQLSRSKPCGAEDEGGVVSETPVVTEKVLGEKKYADGTLLRGSDEKVYVVIGGIARHIVSLEELIKYAGQEILSVEDDEINSYDRVLGERKYADGTLLRGSDVKIYVIIGNKKKHVLNLEELMKYVGREIFNVVDGVISEIENA